MAVVVVLAVGAGNRDQLELFVVQNSVQQFVAFTGLDVLFVAKSEFRGVRIFEGQGRGVDEPVDRVLGVSPGDGGAGLADVNIGHAVLPQVLDILRVLFVGTGYGVARLEGDLGQWPDAGAAYTRKIDVHDYQYRLSSTI